MVDALYIPPPQVQDVAVKPGEAGPLDRMMTVVRATADTARTGDAVVLTGPGVILGYVVHAQTATGVIEIRDSASTGATGTVRVTIPASTAVGVYHFGGVGIACTTGIAIDFTGTGTVSVLYAAEG